MTCPLLSQGFQDLDQKKTGDGNCHLRTNKNQYKQNDIYVYIYNDIRIYTNIYY